jgi:pilus assembly protein CpaE
MLATLDLADQYVITLTPHLGTLRSARHFLHVARTLGYPDDRMCFVLNRATNLAGLSLEDIASLVGSRAIHQIPTSGAELTQAINEGRPAVIHQPKSPVARALRSLAELITARVAVPASRR